MISNLTFLSSHTFIFLLSTHAFIHSQNLIKDPWEASHCSKHFRDSFVKETGKTPSFTAMVRQEVNSNHN